MVKEETPTKEAPAKAHTAVQPPAESSLPLVSMILGILSLAMFMLFLGIPALILGAIGLKKYPTNRAFSITGIVTGAISTFLMLVIILFVAFGMVGLLMNSHSGNEPYYDYDYHYDTQHEYPMGRREGA